MKDAEWLTLMETSPKDAQTALVKEYKNLVYAIVLSKLKGSASPDETEDCVNDAFVEIFASISKFDPNGSLKTFVSTIAVRVAINRFKRIMYRQKMTCSIEEESVSLPPSDNDTYNTVEGNAFRKRLWEIVDSLGELDAKIIVYQYCYELKVHEIADILSLSTYAVQKRSIRARKRIRKILEKENLL